MKNENSHVWLGMAIGALVGAAATYLIVKNKDVIKQEFENMTEKVKETIGNVTNKARGKVAAEDAAEQ